MRSHTRYLFATLPVTNCLMAEIAHMPDRDSAPSFAQFTYRRRALLSTMAATGSAAALSGREGSARPTGNECDRSVSSPFGFVAAGDVDPPVEPDYEVELTERAVERTDSPFGLDAEYFFDPTGLSVEPGATVRFDVTDGLHTVTGYHPAVGYECRVPDEPISAPVLWADTYFLYTFESPGVFDLFCFPHEFLGMVARIVVGEATGPGADAVREPDFALEEPHLADGRLPPQGLAATVLGDDALAADRVLGRERVAWDDVATESKRFPESAFGMDPASGSESGTGAGDGQ